MLYSFAHLMNRANCAVLEAMFENMMMYFRVESADDTERALKLELINRGVIDNSVHFLRPEERWQPDPNFVMLGLSRLQQTINENSSSYLQNRDLSRDKVEKTKFQVMAEVNAMQTLISAALQQAYRYQTSEYIEIFRRFMQPNSRDPDVRDFRARCLSQGIPEKFLTPASWDIEPERIMGGGNKTLEMAQAQQLMEWRTAFGPDAQQRILRKATLAIIDDPAEADTLVPTEAPVSETKHDAMLAFGALMAGAKMPRWPKETNILELTQTLLAELSHNIKADVAGGGMVSQDRVRGYANTLAHVSELIALVGQDPTQKEMAKGLGQGAGNLANEVKGFAQRLAEQQKAQGNGEADAAKAKIAGTLIQAQVKAESSREAHSQKTAQRQVTHEMKMAQDEQKHALEMERERQRIQLEAEAKDIETAAAVRRDAAQTESDIALEKKAAAEAPKPKEPASE